jgi:integrase/recombinase XerD
MVEIVRRGELPQPNEVPERLRAAASFALGMTLREPRPVGFPLLFTSDGKLIEPAVAFLHEHAIRRAHTPDTVRTYMEILYEWFDCLEQSRILWSDADAVDLVAYRNRMLQHPSAHTGRPYSVRTVNHRVRGILRFYQWAVRSRWLAASALAVKTLEFSHAARTRGPRFYSDTADRGVFVLRQYQELPRPLTSTQARDLLARLPPPYDLMARWQLYTGLRGSELLRLRTQDILKHGTACRSAMPPYRIVDVMRKGRKSGTVIVPRSLINETEAYLALHRKAWLARAMRRRQALSRSELFINRRGTAVKKNTYQNVVRRVGEACGFEAFPHLLRATFGCMMLARLEHLAKEGAAINPLLVVKILMAHERIETTDRYLRAIAIDSHVLADVLEALIAKAN